MSDTAVSEIRANMGLCERKRRKEVEALSAEERAELMARMIIPLEAAADPHGTQVHKDPAPLLCIP